MNGVTDHPHGCGENARRCVAGRQRGGSSPRVWGKPRHIAQGDRLRRIIPTGVGKTIKLNTDRLPTPDHPHGCGENGADPIHTDLRFGSSPRVWGKPLGDEDFTIEWRIIPTGVGKTPGWMCGIQVVSDHPHGCGENTIAQREFDAWTGSSPRVWGKQRKYSTRC